MVQQGDRHAVRRKNFAMRVSCVKALTSLVSICTYAPFSVRWTDSERERERASEREREREREREE